MALREIPGVPESTLTPDEAGLLPASTPGPPWRTRVRAVLWVHRSAPGAADLVDAPGPTLPLTVAALVEYLESPVGHYSEVFASPVLLRSWPMPSLRVPFIAVDSIASVHGGRAHWALPKALAEFVWDGDRRVAVTGSGWSAEVAARPRGPRLPLAGGLRVAQPRWAGGEPGAAWVRLLGRARPAMVTVGSAGPTLPQWLRAGRHPGLVIDSARMTVGAPA